MMVMKNKKLGKREPCLQQMPTTTTMIYTIILLLIVLTVDVMSDTCNSEHKSLQNLSDLARKYRKLNAELDPTTDAKSARLLEFYINEGQIIEDEICRREEQHQQPHQQQPYKQSSGDSD